MPQLILPSFSHKQVTANQRKIVPLQIPSESPTKAATKKAQKDSDSSLKKNNGVVLRAAGAKLSESRPSSMIDNAKSDEMAQMKRMMDELRNEVVSLRYASQIHSSHFSILI